MASGNTDSNTPSRMPKPVNCTRRAPVERIKPSNAAAANGKVSMRFLEMPWICSNTLRGEMLIICKMGWATSEAMVKLSTTCKGCWVCSINRRAMARHDPPAAYKVRPLMVLSQSSPAKALSTMPGAFWASLSEASDSRRCPSAKVADLPN